MESTWKEKENALVREFKFQNFKEAINFVNKVAEIAEKENHHPNIFINFNNVRLELFTHSEAKITEKDKRLSRLIDDLIN